MFGPILESAWEGWVLVFSWPNILYPIMGTLLAMVFATLPGVSGVTLMALAIPFTLHWDPLPVMLLFGAFVGGATFMGSVTAILFNVPGNPPNAATVLDGYPLARQGRARTAIACSAGASALGSTFGIIVLILMIPVMRSALLAFGPPEFLMLAIWGLTTLAALRTGSLIKGLAAAGIGLLLAFVGYDPRTAELRYTFGALYLRDGVSLVPVFLGMFALAAVVDLAISGRRTISGQTTSKKLRGSTWEGVRATVQNVGLLLRSSVLGAVIGMIPGVGATVASFLAYGHAVSSTPDRRQFGNGDIRGVLAPEAANDAKDGGSLVPTLAFGIPGGLGTAMLLAALTLHGLAPGSDMLNERLSLVFVLIWSMFVSNWLTSIVGLAAAPPLARLTVVRTQVLVPFVLVVATLGTYIYRSRFEDVVAAYVFGLVGYLMKRLGWPRIPLVVALVLGPLFERNFHLTLRLHELERIDFWTRPVAMSLLALTVVSLVLPYVRAVRERKAAS